MMIRFLCVVGIAASLAGPGLAQSVEDRLIAGLRGQGYTILEEGRTFLGRLRIVAENGTLHREIVANPSTGEILRDYVVTLADIGRPSLSDSATHGVNGAVGSSGTSGTSGSVQPVAAADPVSPVGSTSTANPVTASAASVADPGAGVATVAAANPGGGRGSGRIMGTTDPVTASEGIGVTATTGTILQQDPGTGTMLILADPVVMPHRNAP